MIKTLIANPKNGKLAWVSPGGKLNVQSSDIPQNGQKMLQEPFTGFFTRASDSATNMNVNGAVTAQTFSINSDDTKDKYVKSLMIELTDGGNGLLNEWGDTNAALTNGVLIRLEQDIGNINLHEGIKTNYQLVQFGGFRPSFGATTTTFRASNVNSTNEGWSSFVDLAEVFGLPYGIRIPRNSTSKLSFIIQDDLTAVATFTCRANGFTRLDESEIQEEI